MSNVVRLDDYRRRVDVAYRDRQDQYDVRDWMPERPHPDPARRLLGDLPSNTD